MATVTLPGGPTLSYREWGRPDGAVVLLLHGLGSSSAGWRHLGPVLGRHFRCIAPDARGHGESSWMADYSFEAMRDDVVGLMGQLGILAAIPYGHSMGALTAYLLAATQPDLVRRLVLEEMPPPDAAEPHRPIPRQPDPTADHDWRAVIAVHRWRNVDHPGWWDHADRITVDTLVLGGEQSYLPQSRLRDLAGRLPHGTFASLDLPHGMHEDRPGEVLTVVEPFLTRFAK
ncbi:MULTISPECIES: alpha/beta fold hydrolase [Actinomycetes]|uniref:alpha/beta fold hydrolase n=1 Tax=Actinomycetes TaxID=1760 RepID=UPI0035CA71A4